MYEGVFVIVRKVGEVTFYVEDLVDKDRVLLFTQPLHAARLIKLDMPELELRGDQPRRLEMRKSEASPWNEYVIEKFSPDGRVLLRLPGGDATWYDLTKVEYRWLA